MILQKQELVKPKIFGFAVVQEELKGAFEVGSRTDVDDGKITDGTGFQPDREETKGPDMG